MPEAGGVGTPPGALGSFAVSGKPASNRLCFCLQRLAPVTLLWRLLLGCEPFVHKCRNLDTPGDVHLPPASLRPLTKGSWVCRGRVSLSLASPGPSLGMILYYREGRTLPVMPAFSAQSAPAPSPPSPWSTSFIHLPSLGLLLQSMNQDSDLGRSLRISEPRFSHP